MDGTLLRARELTSVVGGGALFERLDLAVDAGDLVEVRGPNGCGKSTLLRCLAGLGEPTSGRVERRAPLTYLGHKTALSADMTPLENLAWFAAIAGLGVDAAALERALDGVALGAARYDRCGVLSAGQARRAALARLLLGNVPCWLLDEPLTALDDAGSSLVRRMVADHRRRGGAVVCATHGALTTPAERPDEDRLRQPRVVALGS